jgi:hypothetical protein
MELNKIKKCIYKLLFSAIVFCFYISISFSQPPSPPQRTLTVTATQALHFGTLCISGAGGGTVSVGWDGSRSLTGNILLLASAPVAQPAIFEVKLCQGRNVTITYDASTTLTGSNGGSLALDIGPTEKGLSGDHFSTNSDCNFITLLRVGGTLHVPGNVIPGIYTGSFNITFNQQ